jgi:hypothetical protein
VDLRLIVIAAAELQSPVLPPAADVPGPVHPVSGARGEGVGEETTGGQTGVAQVSPGEPEASGVQLSPVAVRHGVQLVVQEVDSGAVDGCSDRHRSIGGVLKDRMAAGEGGVLSRPVAVDRPQAGVAGDDPVDM